MSEKMMENRIGKERGENVTINVYVVRHAEKAYDEKDLETALTPKGTAQSREFGKNLEPKDVIKSYASKTKRAIATGDNIVGASPTLRKGNPATRKELGFEYDVKGDFAIQIKKFKQVHLGPDFDKLSEEEFNKRILEAAAEHTDWFLSFGENRPDEKTNSPMEVVSSLAKLLLRYVKMSKRLNNNSKVDLVNVTHDLNIAALVREVASKVDNKDLTMSDIGGPVKYNEGFELAINRIDADRVKLSLKFRGMVYDLDEKMLADLAK